MAEAKALRAIEDPVVAAAPAGVRIRTRIRSTAAEAAALTSVGAVLGALYRGALAERIRLGRLDHKTHAAWRAGRKQALTAESSSRWAGAITRTVEDQYQLGMRGLAAHVADLRTAVQVLEARCALRPGELEPIDGDARRGARSRRRPGYRSRASASARPGGSRCSADGSKLPNAPWQRADRRSRSVGNACGATAITSTLPR